MKILHENFTWKFYMKIYMGIFEDLESIVFSTTFIWHVFHFFSGKAGFTETKDLYHIFINLIPSTEYSFEVSEHHLDF